MRVAITGAGGLIGGALSAALTADGHEVIRLVRRSARDAGEMPWDPEGGASALAEAFNGVAPVEAVVHLAGAGVGDKRWTPSYKAQIRDSRVHGTTTLATALARLSQPPKVLVSASAVGYYGDTGTVEVDESAPAGSDFLAQVCVDWEASTRAATEAGIRTVHIRTGLLASEKGGAFGRRILPLFKLGLGGRLGSGRQYWSLISLRDEIAALLHLISAEQVAGPVNLVCPEPATNAEVTRTLGEVLHRPSLLPVPAQALRLVLGEFADVGVLAGQRVVPRVLVESGFVFRDPTVRAVVEAMVAGH